MKELGGQCTPDSQNFGARSVLRILAGAGLCRGGGRARQAAGGRAAR